VRYCMNQVGFPPHILPRYWRIIKAEKGFKR
jgi:hypothetical protein